jgi:hypothetical protein
LVYCFHGPGLAYVGDRASLALARPQCKVNRSAAELAEAQKGLLEKLLEAVRREQR